MKSTGYRPICIKSSLTARGEEEQNKVAFTNNVGLGFD